LPYKVSGFIESWHEASMHNKMVAAMNLFFAINDLIIMF